MADESPAPLPSWGPLELSSGCSPSHHKIAHLDLVPLSAWSGYVGLITSTFFLAYFVSTRCLQLIVLPKYQGSPYTTFSYRDQKSVAFHWVAGFFKIVIIALFVGPFFILIFFDGQFDTKYIGTATLGDLALLSAAAFSALFIWELGYRADHINYFSAAHHIATIIMAQLTLAVAAYSHKYKEASVEVYMGSVWAAFELIISLPLDPILIVRRFYLDTRPLLVRNLLGGLTIWSALCTTTEVAITGWLMGVSWHCWGVAWKASIIIVFILWVASQTQTVNAFYSLTMAQHRRCQRAKSIGTVEEAEVEQVAVGKKASGTP